VLGTKVCSKSRQPHRALSAHPLFLDPAPPSAYLPTVCTMTTHDAPLGM
jgi:hypothetical protein